MGKDAGERCSCHSALIPHHNASMVQSDDHRNNVQVEHHTCVVIDMLVLLFDI